MSDRIPVEPWVILAAIRYGLPRLSYARNDALWLIRDHWPALSRWSDSIVDDLRHVADLHERMSGGLRLTAAEIAEMRDLADWCERGGVDE